MDAKALLSFVTWLIVVNSVFGECVIEKPKPFVVALAEQPQDGNPAIECPPPPGPPCVEPSAPTLVSSALTEEVVVQATIPDGYAAVMAWWRVEEEVAGSPVSYYETKSTEVVTNKVGSTVKIGLPGLRKGTRHFVQVGFCRNTIGYPGLRRCNCWSPALTIDTRSEFENSQPAGTPRSNVTLKVEDRFERPTTSAQLTAPEGALGDGDGVGPKAVWEDGFDGPHRTTRGSRTTVMRRTSRTA